MAASAPLCASNRCPSLPLLYGDGLAFVTPSSGTSAPFYSHGLPSLPSLPIMYGNGLPMLECYQAPADDLGEGRLWFWCEATQEHFFEDETDDLVNTSIRGS